MSRRVAHGNVSRLRKWGLSIGWRGENPEELEPEEEPTPAPIADPAEEVAERLASPPEREPLRVTASPLPFGKPLDATVSPDPVWPAPLPEEHLVMTPHCDGRHGPREEADERCVWCDVLTDLASDMRETRRRVAVLEAAVDELRAENERRSEYEREMRERSS